MRTAPAVSFTFPVQRAPGVLAGVLVALAVASCLAWALRAFGVTAWQTGLGAVVPALAAGLVTSWRLGQAALTLRWDRAIWHLAAPATCPEVFGSLIVVVDIGPWMLLRFVPANPGATRWLGTWRGSSSPRWHALRCAVYSPRPAAAPDASPDEAAL